MVTLHIMFSKLHFHAETGEAVKEPADAEKPGEEEEEEAGPGPDPEASTAAASSSNDLNNNNAQPPDKLAPPSTTELGKTYLCRHDSARLRETASLLSADSGRGVVISQPSPSL